MAEKTRMAISKSRTDAAAPGGTPAKPSAKPRASRAATAKPGAARARKSAAGKGAGKAGGPAAKRAAAGRAPRVRRAAAVNGEPPDARGKSLVIVESPTKSKTLHRFLGRDFLVLASNGHVKDLPKSRIGIDIDNDFEPQYEVIPSKQPVLAKLRAAARTASRIFLAPDPDREGEAIAWHLAEELDGGRPIARLTFNEITERAVKAALEHPRAIDMNLVNAQQARRVLDRLVGYKLSPWLWKKMYFGLSAGRVQSVALRLLCEREDEIEAFVPIEYWTLEADFETGSGERFTARLTRVDGEPLEQDRITGEGAGATATALAAELVGAPARVAGVTTRPGQTHPRPPFITSTLQQTAYNRLGFTSQRTMKVAQQLYEQGLITYMRTDSPRLAGEAIGAIRGWLGRSLGAEYVPESPRQFKGRKGAQEAHEAIRPAYVERTPESQRGELSDEQWRLYDLIWKRAVASQAAPSEHLATTVEVESGRLGLKATGRVIKFPGFLKLYGVDEEDDEQESRLPELVESQLLAVARTSLAGDAPPVRPSQHFTQPPPRFTDASIVKVLEEENIGRPSTYATIVQTLISRKYVDRDQRRLTPTDLGRTVNKLLVAHFPDVFDVGFTATMEEELDGIEEGSQEWHKVVRDFWQPLEKDIVKAPGKPWTEPTDLVCPKSGHPMVKKFSRGGAYYACSGYPACKYTRPVNEAELPVPIEGTCPVCGAGLVERTGPYGRYISCERRPDCKYTRKPTLGIPCPQCGEGEVMELRGRKKPFYGCSRYPDCDFRAWDRPRITPCPNCDSKYLVEKELKKGLQLQCPKCKSKFQPEAVGA